MSELVKNNMNFEDYTFKKGDIVNFTFTYSEGHSLYGPQKFKGTFKEYWIIDVKGFYFKFGPRNIKKANYIIAIIEYINEYGVKIPFKVMNEDLKTIYLVS